jgi:hypothetical protein
MIIYLVESFSLGDKAFVDRQLAEVYLEWANMNLVFDYPIKEIELVTDEFMQQIIRPKEQHEINTNSSVQ